MWICKDAWCIDENKLGSGFSTFLSLTKWPSFSYVVNWILMMTYSRCIKRVVIINLRAPIYEQKNNVFL